ncbi:alpha/beta fold hydrolase [Candidatus Nitrosocosmicus arcticus]|uniref:Putative Alpha/beta hydrolase fold protein n=1 Tax=Candidatus Nitrosocosmicus arcticus TaxID=2035267 RepID=A0A557SZ14_9ARCH|nr:alpha/beta hydrolase [Candidatus Nitrosocosmicus arcticus]TVP41851.1 putative Alpha/beta hydrolase fold protein [Candidatus Nitrosocosmicus arcticus]
MLVYNDIQIRKDYLFIVVFISTLIFSSTTLINGFTNVVYGQTNVTQTNSSNTTNLVNTQDIPLEKVRVGDIEMAYKMFGKGDPLILHNGASDNMDAWDPALLSRLASNNTVIVFDSRGIGNTTVGTEPYSIKLLANDTAGLMDALKIQQANVLGYSLGTFTTQQFAITHPDKVSSITLIAGSCGGKDGIPKPPEFLKLQKDIANKTQNNITVPQEDFKALVTASLGSGWVKLHPESAKIPENSSLLGSKPGLSAEALNNQADAGWGWEAQNWSGVCDDLAKIDKPLLVITGTDDNQYNPHQNALVIASKVPGAWLVQIKDAGHAVPNQYPEEVGKIIETFLSTVK